MNRSATAVIVAAASLICGAACAQTPSTSPRSPGVAMPVTSAAAGPGDPSTVELTLEAPAGAVLEVSTAAGEVIGLVTRYGVEGSSTYTLSLPEGIDGDRLRGVVVRPLEGARLEQIDVSAATVRTPAPNGG